MSQCAQLCCNRPATSQCSVCLKEWYCCGECQKADWKKHKLICKTLKKLSNNLQPYGEVVQVILEILSAPDDARVLRHLLSYAQFQFGESIPGKTYRQRGNGERIGNYEVEIKILIPISQILIGVYQEVSSLSLIDRDIKILPLCESILKILKPWSLNLDLDAASRVNSLSKDQIDCILELLSSTESCLGISYTNKSQIDMSEYHYERALSYARRYNEEGKTKTTLFLKALSSYSQLRMIEGNYEDAVTLAEEAYDCVAIACNPVHPQVQEAAGILIKCLIRKGDLYDAERFAQVTLDSLKDPANKVDQEGEEVAEGHYNLAHVIIKQDGDLLKAEGLAREALRIRSHLYGNDHHCTGKSIALLASILRKQGSLGNDVKELYEQTLAIDVKHEGPDGMNTAIHNLNLGHFYLHLITAYPTADNRKEHLRLAESYYTEAIRINTKIFGPTHDKTIEAVSYLLNITRILSEA
jgi:tetratricopeptide (TPR) repeat protein